MLDQESGMLQTMMLGLLFIHAAFAERQLWLSPVSTGDCVAARISAKRTRFVDEFNKKYCSDANSDEAAARRCIENSALDQNITFFTDRCSEKEYLIGVNGKVFRLKRVSKTQGKPHYFVGSFAGDGVSVRISHARLISKTYLPGEPRNESNVLDGAYRVLVTVRKGKIEKTFDGTLLYGR
jgi:hypothetical protein